MATRESVYFTSRSSAELAPLDFAPPPPHHRLSARAPSSLLLAGEQVGEDERSLLPDAWDEAWKSLLGSQLRAALMQIPSEQRKVVALAYFQGWTQSEIAQEDGKALGTVKARMRLGLLHQKQASLAWVSLNCEGLTFPWGRETPAQQSIRS